MATLRNLIDGIAIIAKYRHDGLDSHGIQAEHDEIYCGPDDEAVVSPEDIAKLEELGWHDDRESSGCFMRFV